MYCHFFQAINNYLLYYFKVECEKKLSRNNQRSRNLSHIERIAQVGTQYRSKISM